MCGPTFRLLQYAAIHLMVREGPFDRHKNGFGALERNEFQPRSNEDLRTKSFIDFIICLVSMVLCGSMFCSFCCFASVLSLRNSVGVQKQVPPTMSFKHLQAVYW